MEVYIDENKDIPDGFYDFDESRMEIVLGPFDFREGEVGYEVKIVDLYQLDTIQVFQDNPANSNPSDLISEAISIASPLLSSLFRVLASYDEGDSFSFYLMFKDGNSIVVEGSGNKLKAKVSVACERAAKRKVNQANYISSRPLNDKEVSMAKTKAAEITDDYLQDKRFLPWYQHPFAKINLIGHVILFLFLFIGVMAVSPELVLIMGAIYVIIVLPLCMRCRDKHLALVREERNSRLGDVGAFMKKK